MSGVNWSSLKYKGSNFFLHLVVHAQFRSWLRKHQDALLPFPLSDEAVSLTTGSVTIIENVAMEIHSHESMYMIHA